jgi:23S rRNA (adenine2503-C2)-methyltransferase
MTEPIERVNLKNLSLAELESFVVSLGEKPFRAGQLTAWLYVKGIRSFAEMTSLAKSFREKLAASAQISFLTADRIQSAKDGTKKYRFILKDGERIESVLIPEKDHFTLCLSTQVGCALHCQFCLTGKRGFVRNLDPSEIIDQILGVRATLPAGANLTHLVLMGQGEPLMNSANVLRALEIIRSPQGLQFSNRRVTLSTAGIIPRIEELASRKHFVKLAVSLNATTDQQRSTLMPVNRKYPLKDLLAACRKIPLSNRERITFEYVLLQGVNDSPEDARRLAHLLKGLPAKVNLIPFNEYPGAPFRRPEEEKIRQFQELLRDHRLTTIVRQSKGADIQAACGQLWGK